jgi:hypothetical protein
MGGIVNAVTSIFDGGGGNQVSQPAAPDYTGAANATAAGNLAAARAASAANRVNQITPYGSLNYAETGQDSYGNPTWTATTSLSDVGQKLLNNQNEAALGLGGTINSALGRVQNTMGQEFAPNLPSYGINPGETMTDSVMRRLQPQMQQQQKSFDATMANQGIPVGSEAYMNAKRSFDQQQNDLLTSAVIQGTNTGLTANQQAYNQAMTNYNLPLNTLNALRTGAQAQNPTFVNTPQQATTAGADILGATQMGFNAQQGQYNAQQAQNAGMLGGLMNLGGSLGGAYLLSGGLK